MDEEIIKNYKSCFPKATLILYLDDSVRNMKGVDKTFYLFDRVMSFDKKDSENYRIGFRPLFYSDIFADLRNSEGTKDYDISFVGTCHSDRLSIINKIKENKASFSYFSSAICRAGLCITIIIAGILSTERFLRSFSIYINAYGNRCKYYA